MGVVDDRSCQVSFQTCSAGVLSRERSWFPRQLDVHLYCRSLRLALTHCRPSQLILYTTLQHFTNFKEVQAEKCLKLLMAL